MTLDGHRKVIAAGLTIIRPRNLTKPEIWYKDATTRDWHKMEAFDTKAARDRRFKELLKDPHILED